MIPRLRGGPSLAPTSANCISGPGCCHIRWTISSTCFVLLIQWNFVRSDDDTFLTTPDDVQGLSGSMSSCIRTPNGDPVPPKQLLLPDIPLPEALRRHCAPKITPNLTGSKSRTKSSLPNVLVELVEKSKLLYYASLYVVRIYRSGIIEPIPTGTLDDHFSY